MEELLVLVSWAQKNRRELRLLEEIFGGERVSSLRPCMAKFTSSSSLQEQDYRSLVQDEEEELGLRRCSILRCKMLERKLRLRKQPPS